MEELRNRRSSMRKPKASNENTESLDNPNVSIPNKSRRVSFASSHAVKPFLDDPEKITIWDNTYEEEVNRDDSETVKHMTNAEIIEQFEVDINQCFKDDQNIISCLKTGKKASIVSRKTVETIHDKENIFPQVCNQTTISVTRDMDLTEICHGKTKNSNQMEMELTCCAFPRKGLREIPIDIDDGMEITEVISKEIYLNEKENTNAEITEMDTDMELTCHSFRGNIPSHLQTVNCTTIDGINMEFTNVISTNNYFQNKENIMIHSNQNSKDISANQNKSIMRCNSLYDTIPDKKTLDRNFPQKNLCRQSAVHTKLDESEIMEFTEIIPTRFKNQGAGYQHNIQFEQASQYSVTENEANISSLHERSNMEFTCIKNDTKKLTDIREDSKSCYKENLNAFSNANPIKSNTLSDIIFTAGASNRQCELETSADGSSMEFTEIIPPEFKNYRVGSQKTNNDFKESLSQISKHQENDTDPLRNNMEFTCVANDVSTHLEIHNSMESKHTNVQYNNESLNASKIQKANTKNHSDLSNLSRIEALYKNHSEINLTQNIQDAADNEPDSSNVIRFPSSQFFNLKDSYKSNNELEISRSEITQNDDKIHNPSLEKIDTCLELTNLNELPLKKTSVQPILQNTQINIDTVEIKPGEDENLTNTTQKNAECKRTTFNILKDDEGTNESLDLANIKCDTKNNSKLQVNKVLYSEPLIIKTNENMLSTDEIKNFEGPIEKFTADLKTPQTSFTLNYSTMSPCIDNTQQLINAPVPIANMSSFINEFKPDLSFPGSNTVNQNIEKESINKNISMATTFIVKPDLSKKNLEAINFLSSEDTSKKLSDKTYTIAQEEDFLFGNNFQNNLKPKDCFIEHETAEIVNNSIENVPNENMSTTRLPIMSDTQNINKTTSLRKSEIASGDEDEENSNNFKNYTLRAESKLKNVHKLKLVNWEPIINCKEEKKKMQMLLIRSEKIDKEYHEQVLAFKFRKPKISIKTLKEKFFENQCKDISDTSSNNCNRTDSKGSSIHSTDSKPQNELICELITEASKRNDNGWKFHGYMDNVFFFSALFDSILVKAEIETESHRVSDFVTDSAIKDISSDLGKFVNNQFRLMLQKDHLKSVLGVQYDILTFLDYIFMTESKINLFIEEFKAVKKDFGRRKYIYGFKIKPDNKIHFKALNVAEIVHWNIAIGIRNIEEINAENIELNIIYGHNVISVNELQAIARTNSKGIDCLRKYLNSLYDLILRKTRIKWS